ncbi:MAG TPA: four helix bundle protein [Pyrinomonadaceae bacterium]|nr:four helix bundle protein [Pyrinomonadaceae bacterium]
MKYHCFEELPVWKDAIELATRVFEVTAKPCFRFHSGTRNQLENAAVSVSNNIAEGFERGTTQETLTFLYIARGSCGETRSMLRLLDGVALFSELKVDIRRLIPLSLSISRQLRSWADSLQNSDIRGQRYLSNRSRRSAKEMKEREEFLEELKRIREEHRPGSTTNE